MELDAAAAVMAGLGGVAPPAVDEFRDFLQKIKEQVQVTDFIQVVGTDLLGAKVISAADFSTPPNSLQLAKLTRRIRESGIHIADIDPYGYAPQGYYAQQQPLQSAPIPPVYSPSGATLELREMPQKPGAAGAPVGFVPLTERECFKCGQKGHIAAKCTAK